MASKFTNAKKGRKNDKTYKKLDFNTTAVGIQYGC